MLIAWLIYGLIVFGVAKLLNATLFKIKPASRPVAIGLTILSFVVSVAILAAQEVLQSQTISNNGSVPIKSQNLFDMAGALSFACLFFSFLKREKKQPPSTGNPK